MTNSNPSVASKTGYPPPPKSSYLSIEGKLLEQNSSSVSQGSFVRFRKKFVQFNSSSVLVSGKFCWVHLVMFQLQSVIFSVGECLFFAEIVVLVSQ